MEQTQQRLGIEKEDLASKSGADFFISLCSEAGRQPIQAPKVFRLLPFPPGIETTEVTEGEDQVIDKDPINEDSAMRTQLELNCSNNLLENKVSDTETAIDDVTESVGTFDTDVEREERQKIRQLEIEALSKTLAMLSSDDTQNLFTKTFNPAFVRTEGSSARLTQVSEVLARIAKKLSSTRLAAIAMRVKLDAFEKVKQAIGDMVTALLKEKADEIKHKDFCVEEFNENQLETEAKECAKTGILAKVEDLGMPISTLTADIDRFKTGISESQVQMKRDGQDMEKQIQEFQMTGADQRAIQKLLNAVLTILQGSYEKKADLLQQEPVGPPPPPGFKEAYCDEETDQWDATLCHDSKTCTQNCVFEGADAEYAAAYGVHTAGELTDEPAGAEKKGWCNAEKQRTEHTERLEVMTLPTMRQLIS